MSASDAARHVQPALRHIVVPKLWGRALERVLFEFGALSWRSVEAPIVAARRALLGDNAPAPPRFLIRVDEFPNFRAWDPDGELGVGAFERFHEITMSASAPYLLAALPFVSRDPLDPARNERRQLSESELAMLARLASDGVELALHGRDHRTRFASAHRRSELCGLSLEETEALLDEALAELRAHGLSPSVFVAPYNRFDAHQLPLLAQRFAVVCGGVESIGTVGFQSSPQWLCGTVYLPSYPPFYGTAEEILPAAKAQIEAQTGMWVPLTLHWQWETRDAFEALKELLALIAPMSAPWPEFLAAVARSSRLAS